MWAEARSYAWARSQRAVLTGDTTAHTDLPPIDVAASVGLSAPLVW